MYYNNKESGVVAKEGRIAIEIYRDRYRLRFTYAKRNYTIAIGKVGKETLKAAIAKAQQINSDITFNQFDSSLIKYDPERAQALEIVKEETAISLDTIWQRYKTDYADKLEKTTIKTQLPIVDRLLIKLDKEIKLISKVKKEIILQESLKYYSEGTLEKLFAYLNAALNYALKIELIDKNPLKDINKLLSKNKKKNKRPECFINEEVNEILNAFKNNTYVDGWSNYQHSYYYNYVKFLSLTGCRPEEAIALTWSDIYLSGGNKYITISKAYSKGILKRTKTKETRILKCNEQLRTFLEELEEDKVFNEFNLLFIAQEGGYISQANFGRRYWKPIVTKLVKENKVRKYLRCYNLRHTWITNLVRAGIDIATVAALAGNSTEMIAKYYLAAEDDIDIPYLY